jgi:5,10-methylenetetrahydromethanopterin reductase
MTHFGVQLHGTFPMRRYPELARAIERHPFAELTVHDVVWWRPVWPILTLIAAATERVLVGPDVTHPYLRHPADTAANVAALDELSDGRAILGIGAGSLLGPLGITMRKPLAAVRECTELVQRLLARERTPYEGEVFTASPQAQFLWEPVRTRVPCFVGAIGPKMTRAAAHWADELRQPAVWAPGYFAETKRVAEAEAAAAGNDGFAVGCDVWISLGDDRDQARALGRRILAQFLPTEQLAPMRAHHEIDEREVGLVRERTAAGDLDGAAEAVSDRTLDTFVAAGDASDVAAGLRRLLEVGPASITFSGRLGPDPERAIELLGTRVLPEAA